MALSSKDVVEGYFVDLNNRLTREAVESGERDIARVSYRELAQSAGQLAVGNAPEGIDLYFGTDL